MRKFQIVLVSALILILALSFVACNNDETPQVDATLDANFIVDTTPREVNFGESFVIEPVSAKDSAGEWHDATIEITDPNGNTKAVEAGSYTPQYLGTYKITYKISTLTREVVVTVKDLSEPEITGMTADSLVMLGDTVDLSKIKVKDNIDGEVSAEVSVKFGTDEIALTDNKFVADRKGCYVVTVKAKDAAGNELNKTLNVFTQIDYEQNIAQTSEFFPIEISNKFNSYRPGNVAKIGWFDTNVSWLNDYCLLGSKTTFLSEAQYLSFWTYFDGEATDLNQLLLQTKYTYFDTKIYTEYGKELDYYYNFILSNNAPEDLKTKYASSNGKFVYELEANKWYRVVIDLKSFTNASKYGVTKENGSPIDGPLADVQANPKGFADIAFGFGTWDRAIGGQATKVVDTYIDDIRLTNTLEDETYRKEIKVNVTSDASVTKKVNETFNITYNVENVENGKVTFSSTDESVATVDENGVVTCIAEGQAKIVLTSVDDARKTAEIGVTVAAAGAKVRDENNQEIFSGGKSIGSWETDGKYNMVEHMTWACNDNDNGVCNHSDLVSMSIAHGTLDSYSPLTKDGGNLSGDTGSAVRIEGGWNANVTGSDALMFVFTAKQDISIKTTGDTVDNNIGGWLENIELQWVKIKTDGTAETLKTKVGPAFADVESDWFELSEGETFVLVVKATVDADRSFQILPFFYICPMIEAAE